MHFIYFFSFPGTRCGAGHPDAPRWGGRRERLRLCRGRGPAPFRFLLLILVLFRFRFLLLRTLEYKTEDLRTERIARGLRSVTVTSA